MDSAKDEEKSLTKDQNAQTSSEERDSFYFDTLPNHKEITVTIWGDEIKQDVFERWSQGFLFESKKEPTALLQHNGGPCPIIAAVQAYLFRELLFCHKCGEQWRTPDETELNNHLTDSLLSIFINLSSDTPKYLVFYEPSSSTEDIEKFVDESEVNSKRVKFDYDAFSKKLKVYKFKTLNELKLKLNNRIQEYKKDFGVICFLYSLLLTKGLDSLKKELEESRESLIDSLHGHGNQNLTNLLLFGIATSNVFDGEKCLEGLKLNGIPKQSTIGFLTIMEYLRYCEVGWNLKNPKIPIWILGSETHLTVFASKETALIQKNDSNRQIAIKSFQKFDPYENGFVKTEDLEKLMESLDLLTDKEYIEVVKQQLDTENLGIITKSAFLNEFYPESEPNYIPDSFEVFHYNGLARSNLDNEVQYSRGIARLIDFTDQPSLDVNSIKNCLQTKWPTIEIKWDDAKPPSLN